MSRHDEDILQFARETALSAGALAAEMRRPGLAYDMKSAGQMVTAADTAAENLILGAIRRRFPDHLIWAEETAAEVERARLFHEPAWIVDPIDGTTNFAHGQWHVGVSIAYCEAGRVRAGVVHMPFLNETFTAAAGCGAHLNGVPIRCSRDAKLEGALIGIGRPGDDAERRSFVAQLHAVLQHCFDVRRLAAAAGDICYVACGRLHGFWESLHSWDMAAACLIAREAGAEVGHIGALPEPLPVPLDLYPEELLVAAPCVYARLEALLRQAAPA